MNNQPKENHFDRSKIFYPYVMQYIITYHGFIELLSRGAVMERSKINNKYGSEKVQEFLNCLEDKDKASEFICKEPTLTPLLLEPSLYSNYMEKAIDINIDEIANELISNILQYIVKAAGILLIMGFHETKNLDDKSEIWNFFYHCRNAAAHGGKFNITNPRFPAKWGNIEITQSLNGTNLFFIPNEGGLLKPGDPIRFLWEIEQKYM